MKLFLNLVAVGLLVLVPVHSATIEEVYPTDLQPGETRVVQGNADTDKKGRTIIKPLATNFHTVTSSGQIVEGSIYAGETRQDRIQFRRSYAPYEKICQVRIDFLEFQLAQPNTHGDCNVNDKLTISVSQSLQNFQLCGENKGQHLYLHYGDSDVITVNVLMEEAGSKFKLNTTFFSCYDPTSPTYETTSGPEAAPYGCTQYYNDLTADVKSFNYLRYLPLPYKQRQINNQRYTICMKDYPDIASIQWKICSREDHFFISGEYLSGSAGYGPTNCTGDYVDIPGSQKGRYCGNNFYETTTSAKPFTLWVNFNTNEDLEIQDPRDPPPGIICSMYPDGTWTCEPDPYYPGPFPEFDVLNGGFCLKYVIM